MSKKTFWASAIIASVIIVFSGQTGITNAVSPPLGRTGAPSEATCATAAPCHVGVASIAITEVSANITGAGAPSATLDNSFQYWPDSIYTIDISVLDLTGRYGFELTCLKALDNTAAGSFTLTSPTNTAANAAGGRNYVTHKNASTLNSWSFKWQAPSVSTGDIKFYLCCNAANNNNNSSGDHIYTYNAICSERHADTLNAIAEGKKSAIQLLETNPGSRQFFVSYGQEWKNKKIAVMIINLNGAKIKSLCPQNGEKINLIDLSSGLYFALISDGENNYVQQIIL